MSPLAPAALAPAALALALAHLVACGPAPAPASTAAATTPTAATTPADAPPKDAAPPGKVRTVDNPDGLIPMTGGPRPPPEPPLTQEELDLIAADPATLTPELRRKRAFAVRRKILQNPDSPGARQLEAMRLAAERGEIKPQLPSDPGLVLKHPVPDSYPRPYPRALNMRRDLVHEHTVAPGLLRWTLSNPAKRNALSVDMLTWLQRRAAALSGEVVLLGGEGEPSFCAGFDLDALPEEPVIGDMSEAPDAALIAATAALRRADATFIAVLHGPIFGAGVELACCCDLRLARDDTRFTVPAARLGVVYHPAGVDLLQRCLGLALTQRLLLLGDTLDAAELLRAGGLHGVHPEAELADAAQRVAERLLSGSPASIRAHRDRLRGVSPGPALDSDPDRYEAARRAAYESDDYREARAAARERRPARFTGR